jgi:hypothetical protein
MRKIPHFNLDYTQTKTGICNVSLNGLYIGRILDYYKNNELQFVPKGFDQSFLRHDIQLKSFKTVDEVMSYLRLRVIKRYIKYGEFI